MRAATLEPEPLDEPPVTRAVSHGLRQAPEWKLWPARPNANSALLSVPRVSAPAAPQRANAAAGTGGLASAASGRRRGEFLEHGVERGRLGLERHRHLAQPVERGVDRVRDFLGARRGQHVAPGLGEVENGVRCHAARSSRAGPAAEWPEPAISMWQ